MNTRLRLEWFLSVVCLTLGVILLQGLPAEAQDATGENDPSSVERQGETSPQLSQSDRLLRLEQVIESDKEKLAEIKQDLADREAFYDDLTSRIKQGEIDLAAGKKRLEELGGAEASEEAAELAAEIVKGEEWLPIARSQSDLTFQSAKTLQEQIQALELKIAEEEKALANLVGPSAEELEQQAAPTEAASGDVATPTPGLTPGQVLLPGSGGAPSRDLVPEQAREKQPTTAEQIEARHEAEKAEEEARKAKEAVLSFVERKEALESQIAMEQQLLETARESRDNLDVAVQKANADLEKLIAEDASRAVLQKARGTLEMVEQLKGEAQAEIDNRRDYLDSLYERLDNLHEEQLAITQEADEKRREAEAARKKTVWLESPLHPKNLWHWLTTRGPRMLLVVVVAWALLALVRLSATGLAKTVVGVGRADKARGKKRADTLALSFRSAVSLFIVVAAVLLVFQEAGVDIKTVLGGAAILGVGLAFGAQNLMRDYFTGFMILLEDQFELGDLITIGGITGRVERVNMRTTMLRDIEGRVHFIPNGEIKAITNRTYVWGRAVLEIPISFKEDVDRVMGVIVDEAEKFRADPEVGEWVTDTPVMLGVDKFTESGAIIKFMVQTQPDKIFATRRQLFRRIKNRFDAEGIEISVPHRILMHQKGDD